MPASTEFTAHCVELLSPLGPARARRMFGGQGFYVDDIFVAIAIAERLYLKTDTLTRARFEAAGGEPFIFDSQGKQVTISYWTVPEDAMESPQLMLPWARLAMEAGLRARNAKPAPRKKKTPVKPAPAPARKKRAASKPTR